MHCHCLNPSPNLAKRRPSLPSALLFPIVREQVLIALRSMEQQENRTGCLGQPKRVAAEVVSLLVEIGGLCRVRYFFCSQFATAVLTTSFAFGVEKAGPFIDTFNNEHFILQPVSQSRFDPFNLSCPPFLAKHW